MLYSCPRPAVLNGHKLGGLDNKTFIRSPFWVLGLRCQQGCASSEGSREGFTPCLSPGF